MEESAGTIVVDIQNGGWFQDSEVGRSIKAEETVRDEGKAEKIVRDEGEAEQTVRVKLKLSGDSTRGRCGNIPCSYQPTRSGIDSGYLIPVSNDRALYQ